MPCPVTLPAVYCCKDRPKAILRFISLFVFLFVVPTLICCSELDHYNTNNSEYAFCAAFPRLVYLTNTALISLYMQDSTTVIIKLSSKIICLTTLLITVHLPYVYLIIAILSHVPRTRTQDVPNFHG